MAPHPPKKKRLPLILLIGGGIAGSLFLCFILLVVVSLANPQKVTPTPETAQAIAVEPSITPEPSDTPGQEAPATATESPSQTPRPTDTSKPSVTPSASAAPRPSSTPSPTATTVPTDTAVPTPEPSPTFDPLPETLAVYNQILVLFAPGEAAAADVTAEIEAIGEGTSTDTVELYLLAKTASEIWSDIAIQAIAIDAEAEELNDAIWDFSLSAQCRSEAYASLMSFLDNQRTSDRATFQEKAEQSQQFQMSGIIKLMTYAPGLVAELAGTPTPAE